MANLTDVSIFSDVYQWEVTDPAQGGAGGIMNVPTQQLANRTRYLYDRVAASGFDGNAVEFSGNLNTLSTPGFYLVRGTPSNAPTAGIGHLVVTGRQSVPESGGGIAAGQMYLAQTNGEMYFRTLAAGVWSAWRGVYRSDAAATFAQMFVAMVAHFPTAAAPSGWLPCNGAAVSRTTYSALFARIGTTYGAGNGSTTFNLPDLRGEFLRGLDDGRGLDVGRTLTAEAQGGVADTALHVHNVDRTSAGAIRQVVEATSGGLSVHLAVGDTVSTTTSSTPPGHPRNMALLTCIKY